MMKSKWFRWPWVSRKRLAAVQEEHERLRRSERERHAKQQADQNEHIKELIGRFAQIRFGRRQDPASQCYRIACEVTLDPHLVHELFVQGNDSPMFGWIADKLGHLVERELHTINFVRLPQVTELLQFPAQFPAQPPKPFRHVR